MKYPLVRFVATALVDEARRFSGEEVPLVSRVDVERLILRRCERDSFRPLSDLLMLSRQASDLGRV